MKAGEIVKIAPLHTTHIRVRDSTVTAPKTQIQALINKIDEVLQGSEPTRSRSHPQGDMHQQQILEQARHYLVSLQGQEASFFGGSPNMGESPFLPVIDTADSSVSGRAEAGRVPTFTSGAASPGESAQQVLQAVVQEMNYLRVNMMQPLREELMTLYQQRQMLTADIKRLEQQRYQLMLASQQFNQQKMIEDFLQSLMGRLQEQLATQVAQTYANLELQAAQLSPSEQATEYPQLTPGQRLQHMQQLQAASDEVMLNLDSTLRVVFDSLQTNVDSYQDSLAKGLEKMHGLGQQGEAMFAALVNRFAQQLGRGASYYLQSSMRKEWELPGLGTVEGPEGGIMPREPVQSEEQVSILDKVPDDQLNRMIGALADDGPSVERPNNSSGSASELDDGLIDELLGILGAEAFENSGGVDFNLNDIELAPPLSAESTEEVSAESDFSITDDSSINSGDRPSLTQEDLTLFEISDDGVQTHFDDDRISQIEEADTDDFLSELSNLSSDDQFEPQSEPQFESLIDEPLIDEPSAQTASHPELISQGGDNNEDLDAAASGISSDAGEEDEALAFLDQIASEMEHDLSNAIHTDLDNSESQSSGNWEDPEQNNGERDDADQFNAARLSSEADSLAADLDALDNGEGDRPLDATAPLSEGMALSSTSEAEMSDESSRLLSDLFADSGASGDDLFDIPSQEALNLAPDEPSPDQGGDLFSELGITTQGTPLAESLDTSNNYAESSDTDRVETITSLADLVDDANARASIEATIRNESHEGSTTSSSDDPDLDPYVLASPHEDLLIAEESDAETDVRLSLDTNQRQQLASDLAKVEGLDTSDVLSPFEMDFSDDQYSDREDTPSEDATSNAPLENETIEEVFPADDALFALGEPASSALSQPPVTLEGFSNEIPTGSDSGVSGSDASASVEEAREEETLQGLFDEAVEDADPRVSPASHEFPGAVLPVDSSSQAEFLDRGTVDDLFGEVDTAPSESVEPASEELPTSVAPSQPSGTETVRELFTGPEQPAVNDPSGSSLDMTVESLFQGMGEPQESPSEPIVNPFDTDEELRGIFEDLQAFDEAEAEASQTQEEKTLMDLMKGFNQPTLPSDSGESSGEMDTSWSIFDEVNDSGQDSGSGEKKN